MTGQELITTESTDIQPTAQEHAGQVANYVAAKHAFSDYQDRKAANTLTVQRQALQSFTDYLADVGTQPGDLYADPEAWRGVTWGLVEGFVKWLLNKGYSLATVNVRLSTVKVYAKLAAKAGAIEPQDLAMIQTVSGYRHSEGKNIDATRDTTRRGLKKADWTVITPQQAEQLKRQADTPQGRRDAVIMTVLIDHGLRVSELARLTVGDVDLENNELRFYRPKTDDQDKHWFTPDSREALRAYMTQDAPAIGPLLKASHRHGGLTKRGMSIRAISARVKVLGQAIGIEHLSPHDLRHFGATDLARNNTPLDRLQAWGGWNSVAMPMAYIERAEHGNEGVIYGSA